MPANSTAHSAVGSLAKAFSLLNCLGNVVEKVHCEAFRSFTNTNAGPSDAVGVTIGQTREAF